MPSDTSWLEIDLAKVQRNFLALKKMVTGNEKACPNGPSKPKLCCVVKKDAYGLGASQVAHRLVKAGCDMLAVYSASEAERLILKSVTGPIMILGPVRELNRTDALYRPAVAGQLHLTIHDLDQLQAVNQIGRTFGIKLPIHLHLDTGMSRSGLNEEQFAQAFNDMGSMPHVRVAGVWSHLATADDNPDFAYEQLERFESVVEAHAGQLPDDCLLHIANSFATLRDRRFHLDMVRPGLGVYGYAGELMTGPILDEAPTLEHPLRWVTHINHVQRYPRWTPVGYGSTHKLKRNSVIGVVPVGYGDGYPVALSNQASVRVFLDDQQGTYLDAPVLGRVNMDQLTIDLTDAPGLADGADPHTLMNATVHVISDDPAAPSSVPNLARLAGTHPYEIICRLSKDLPRRYIH